MSTCCIGRVVHRWHIRLVAAVVLSLILSAGCGKAASAAPAGPTMNTSIPPTAEPLPPATPATEPGPFPFACTSFAVYSDETFYGMNFDYPDTEIRFTITPSGDLKVFQMEFWQEGGFVPTVGMNSAGLFGSCQMLFPEAPAATSRGADDIYPWQLYRESLLNFDRVEELSEFISDRRVVHGSLTLHDLFADVHGDAMVVEAGDEENVITRIEDDFIVMTNFPNGDFAGQSYTGVAGAGADRYKIAYENISGHIATFDLDRGFDTLEKAILSGEFSTQASMVFDPERGEVYIALKRDFSKIWKVSIADETIETFSGYGSAEKTKLDSSGILASDLESAGASQGIEWGYYIIGLAVVLVGGGVCFLVIIRKRWHMARQEILAWLPVVGGFVVVGAIIGGVYALSEARTQERDSAPTQLPAEPEEDVALLSTLNEPTGGSRVAYVTDQSDEDEFSAIYVMDADGSNPQRVAGSNDGFCLFPSWSPDGQKIAYLIQTPGEDGVLWNGDPLEIWVTAVDGSEQIRVSDAIPSIHEASIVTWSPDGTRLAFTAEPDGNTTETIYVVRADGSEVEHSIPLDWEIDRILWSPTGEELLFIPESRTTRMTAHLLSLEGEQIEPVYEVRMLDSWGSTLGWSPNGVEFAVANPLAQEVLIVSTDGELHQAVQVIAGFPVEIAWSPNGAYFAVSTSPVPLDDGATQDTTLHMLEIETGNVTAIFYDEEKLIMLPSWSSDSNHLLFTTLFERPEESELSGAILWVYDVASDTLEQVTMGVGYDGMGAWSP